MCAPTCGVTEDGKLACWASLNWADRTLPSGTFHHVSVAEGLVYEDFDFNIVNVLSSVVYASTK